MAYKLEISAFAHRALIVVLILALCFNTGGIYYLSHNVNRFSESPDYTYIGDDVPRELPTEIGHAAMVIRPSSHYPMRDDAAWASTLAPHRGFIRLGPDGSRPFGVSLYHQLHCVNAIRFAYMIAKEGIVTDPSKLRSDFGHTNHCFQFLRQSILCRADTTLVPRNASESDRIINGAQTHRCRDWTQVRNYVVLNQERWKDVPLPEPQEIVDSL